jgi:hypothetical protein
MVAVEAGAAVGSAAGRLAVGITVGLGAGVSEPQAAKREAASTAKIANGIGFMGFSSSRQDRE